MKKIVCELCEGMEFAKEGGMFVCQGCGTKYTAEEAKGMMREVEGAAPVSTGAPVGVPVGNPNQQQIDNLLVLASNAFESSNNQETEGYCNKIIELDVTCYKAWLLKGQAIGWQSTYGNPRVDEGANAMRKAYDFAPEEEKENVAKQSLRAIRNICNALASLAKENFGNSPTEANRKKFTEFHDICVKATDLFNDVSEEIKQFGFDEWKAHKKYAAEQMNLAGVAAIKMIREKWDELDHPNTDSLTTYLDWYGEAEHIFQESIDDGLAVDEDDEEIITRYENKIVSLEDPMDASSWERVWQSWSSSYVWQKDKSLTDGAKKTRRNQVQECKDAIEKIKNKAKEAEKEAKKAAEEAKKERIKAYWEAHKEEKDKLETEKKELETKQKDIKSQVSDIEKQIKDIEAENSGKVPSEEESDKLHTQIQELNKKRDGLGLFAGKEKKAIGEEIASLEGRLNALKEKAKEEKKERDAKIAEKVNPLKAKKEELNKELPKISKRISDIDAELNKDPEE